MKNNFALNSACPQFHTVFKDQICHMGSPTLLLQTAVDRAVLQSTPYPPLHHTQAEDLLHLPGLGVLVLPEMLFDM